MFWSQAILLLLVGAAFSTPQSAWKNGKEYTYKIKSRTLAALNPHSRQYSGILMEARLTVQPNGQDSIRAKIVRPQYSPIHTHLENGWDSEIPQNQINLQSYPLTDEPFDVNMRNGVIQELVVNKDVPTWQVNILKSIVSQLQVDTQGENAKQSKHNQFPEGDEPYALYKTMEDSVGGQCEVLYDVSPLSEQVLQNKPELVPMPELREDGDVIFIAKTKNYSNCDQRVSYHYGISGRNMWEPGSNDNGKYLSRSSVSRVVISGNLKSYTIQSSINVNKIVLRPDQQENQQGMVASKMNLTLHEVKDSYNPLPAPSNPQSTGNLVYNYNNPFENVSSRRPNKNEKPQKHANNGHSDESNSSDNSDSIYDNNGDSYLQPQPKLTEPPHNPMLPYFIGNNGNNIQKNNKVDVISSTKNIAQQIGNEMETPDNMPKEETLEKFTILSNLIRLMNAEQIAEVQRSLYEQPQSSNQLNQRNQAQNVRRNAWVAFRDAVAQSGTGPALVNIKQWIQNKQIQGNEAAFIVDTLARSTETPTSEYMDSFFDMATMQETKKQSVLRDVAISSFADLVRHAVVNKRSAHNRFPVHAFGRFFSRKNNNVEEKYIPYLANELKAAVDSGDSQKVQVYAIALGRTAHPQMLSVFEPYLEGKKQISSYQRLVMVLSMYKLATSHPKVARSVLYKIYSNNGDHHEIRTAAVYLLMYTNPPASMLQRMADFTNYDSNKHVNSAVKSTIESLAQLQGKDTEEISNAAKTAVPLLTSETYGFQHSRALFRSYKNHHTHSGVSLEVHYIGSDDSIIPKGVTITVNPNYMGLKGTKVQFGFVVSSVQNMWKFMQQKLYQQNNRNDQKAQQQQYSPENLAKLLNIHGDEPEQVEGSVILNGQYGNYFFSFDNHSLEQIPEELKELNAAMKKGRDFEVIKFTNQEVVMSFPTETGYPFVYRLQVPSLMNVKAQAKSKSENNSGSQSEPQSVTVSGNVHAVYGLKIQKRIGFVSPFEHQEYVAGNDRSLQVHLPIRSEIEYNNKKREAWVKLQPNENEHEYQVLQYRQQPYTSKYDILSLQPVSNDKNTHIVHKNHVVSSQMNLNDNRNEQRVQFSWETQADQQNEDNQNYQSNHQNVMKVATKLAHSIAGLYNPNDPEKMNYEQYTVKLFPSSDMSAEVRVSYDSLTTQSNNNADDSQYWSPNAKAPHLEKNLNENQRKQKFLNEVSQKINSAKANVVDISLQVNGGIQSSMALTAAFANSNVDQKSRALVYASARYNDGQNYHFSAGFEGKTPNVRSLDFEETLKANTPHEYNAEMHYGKDNDERNGHRSTIKIQGNIKQTEVHKNGIRRSHEAQLCAKQQSMNGNKMSPACQKVNQRAAIPNNGQLTITFDNESVLQQLAMRALDLVENMAQNYAEVWKNYQDKEEMNKINIGFKTSPNNEHVDVTFTTSAGKVEFNNIRLDHYQNKNYKNNEDSEDKQNSESLLQDDSCYLDKTQVTTFDNHNYPLQLGKCWHVAMSTYPKNDPDRPSQTLEVPENMHVSILTRENDNGQKELKITLGEKQIELSVSGSHQTQAKVNGQKVNYSKQQSYQEQKEGHAVFEIFQLPDNSVKLVSDKYNVEVVYDGQRAQIQGAERYRDSVRGLCGNNDGEPENDQHTPQGCHLHKSAEFAATYALINDNQCAGPARQNAQRAKNSHCAYESVRFGNVISNQEAGRQNQQWNRQGNNNNQQEKQCIAHRTKVTRSQTEICFSLRPVPTCLSGCSPTGVKSKTIQFHCIARGTTAEKVATRVENGANPDLSQKSVSKSESHPVPISCGA